MPPRKNRSGRRRAPSPVDETAEEQRDDVSPDRDVSLPRGGPSPPAAEPVNVQPPSAATEQSRETDTPSRWPTQVKLPKYNGREDEDLEGWLFSMTEAAKLYGWSKSLQLRHAVSALQGRALSEYRTVVMSGSGPDWDAFASLMRKQFGPTNPIAHWNKKLMSVKQAPQETVASYDMRFRQVASQLNQALSGSHLPEETLVTWFHEGLRPEYQDELERDQPETLQEAVKSAEKAERIKKRQHRHGMPGMVGVVSSSRGTQQLQEADVTTQMMQQLIRMSERQEQMMQMLIANQQGQLPPVSGPVSSNMRPQSRFYGKCYNCDKFGHRPAECRSEKVSCRKPQQQSQQQSQQYPLQPQSQQTPQEAQIPGEPQEQVASGINQQTRMDPPQPVMRVEVSSEEPLVSDSVESGASTSRKESLGDSTYAGGLPVCRLAFQGVDSVSSILDSGAAASIVSAQFASLIKQEFGLERRALIGANGGELHASGSLSLSVSLGDQEIQHTFAVIEDFPYPVLLGTDFLSRVKAVVDFSKGVVTLNTADGYSSVQLPISRLYSNREESWVPDFNDSSGRTCIFTSTEPCLWFCKCLMLRVQRMITIPTVRWIAKLTATLMLMPP